MLKRLYSTNLNKYSSIITQSNQSGPAQAMLHALNLNKNDIIKPHIGIGSVWYESNPCNSHLNILSQKVKKCFNDRDLTAFQFNSVGVSDGISMGTFGMQYSLLSRELIADSFETICSAHHYDGLIGIPGCDKNLPGILIAMCRLNRPSFIIYGGAMKPNLYNNKELDIVSAFESYGELKSGKINEEEYQKTIENSCNKQCGACSGLYTANTMASIFEVMGITPTNSSSNPANSLEKFIEIDDSYKIMKNLLKENIRPSDILTKESFINGIKMLYATGGSTNAIIHLLAIAKSINVNLSIEDFNKYSNIPVLLNMKPHGKNMMYHLHKIGGMKHFIKDLIEQNIINGDILTITGKSLKENVESNYSIKKDIIHSINNPFKESSHIKVLKGNIAPNGCVSKIYKSDKIFKGFVKVFESENNMINSLNNNEIKKDNFIVIRGQGETIGCPEMLKPTSALVGYFGSDIPALLTDGRFSGGSHGILIAHLEDKYKKKSITSILKDNDVIEINLEKLSINLLVTKKEINKRLKKIKIDKPKYKGVLKKFSKYVDNINSGFLIK